MKKRLAVLLTIWLVLIILVGTGLLTEAAPLALTFGAWTGGVISTMIYQHMRDVRGQIRTAGTPW